MSNFPVGSSFACQYPPRISTIGIACRTIPILGVATVAFALLAVSLTASGVLPPVTALAGSIPLVAVLMGSVGSFVGTVSLSAPLMNLLVVGGGTLLVSAALLVVALIAHAAFRSSDAVYLAKHTPPGFQTPDQLCAILQDLLTEVGQKTGSYRPRYSTSITTRSFEIESKYDASTGKVRFWLIRHPQGGISIKAPNAPRVEIIRVEQNSSGAITVGLPYPGNKVNSVVLHTTQQDRSLVANNLLEACDGVTFPVTTQ